MISIQMLEFSQYISLLLFNYPNRLERYKTWDPTKTRGSHVNSEKNILLLYACIKRHANRHSVKMSQWSSEYFAPWRVFKYWNSLFMLYYFCTKSYHKKSLRTFPFSSGYSFFRIAIDLSLWLSTPFVRP